MSSSIFPFRRAFLKLVILSIIGGLFVFFTGSFARAVEPINFDTLDATLQLVKNPDVQAASATGEAELSNYSASLTLAEPNILAVGQEIILGARGGSVIVSGFGLGLLKPGDETTLCQNRGSYTSCDFRYTVPVQRTSLSASDPAGGLVILNKDIEKLLGITEAERDQLAVYPFIETAEGQKLVLMADKATPGQSGQVQGALDWIGAGILTVVNSILGAIASAVTELLNILLYVFIAPFIEALLAIRTYTDQFASIIYPAWEVFRNLANILFILAIIATGLATVFRVGGWQAKDILVKLIIGAILINFSLVIAQSVLGIADTVQNQFLPANTGAIRLLGEKLITKGTQQTWDNIKLSLSNDPATSGMFGTFGESVRILAAMISGIIAFVAFVAIAIFLGIRIVFLWLLLMTSPLPYVAMVLPVTRSITQRWWSNFIKYAFMTPAMAFMLNLSALIADRQQNIIKELSAGANGVGRYGALNGSIEQAMFTLGANAIVIIFLFLSLKVASALGAESGGLIEKVSDKGWRSAMWGAKAPLGAAGLGLGALNRLKQERTQGMSQSDSYGKRLLFAALNPITSGKQFMARRQEKKDTLQAGMDAAAYDAVGRLAPKSIVGPRSRRLGAFTNSQVAKVGKEQLPPFDEDLYLQMMKEIIASGKTDQQTRHLFMAITSALNEDGDFNDILTGAKDQLGMSENFAADRHGYAAWWQEVRKRGLVNAQEEGSFQAQMSDIHKKNGTVEYINQFRINDQGRLVGIDGELVEEEDPETGRKYKVFKPTEGVNAKAWGATQTAIDKHINKIGASKRAQQHNSAWVYDDENGGKQLNEAAIRFMAVTANQRDWDSATSLDTRARQYMIEAMRDEGNRAFYMEQVKKEILKDEATRGVEYDMDNEADRAKIEAKANARMKEFTQKYLLYDVEHDEKLDREEKHRGQDLVNDPEFSEIIHAAAKQSSGRRNYLTTADTALFNMGSLSLEPTAAQENLFRDTTTVNGKEMSAKEVAEKLHEKVFEQAVAQLTQKIDPRKFGLIEYEKDASGEVKKGSDGKPIEIKMTAEQMRDYEAAITKVITDVRDKAEYKGKGFTMRNVADELQANLESELEHVTKSGGGALSEEERKSLAKRIFGSLKENRA